MQEIGFGLTREMVGNVVMEYLQDKKQENPFFQDKPGNDWWLGFMRGWPKLTERKPQHLQANRATALTEGAVNAWISKVSTVISDAGLGEVVTEELSKRMWKCDETAFATDVASKILARKGEKNVHETGGGSGREHITVLGCESASGERLPPYVVYTRARTFGPPGQVVGQLVHYTPYQILGGWNGHTFLNGLESFFFLLFPASWKLDQSSSSWMAMPLTLT